MGDGKGICPLAARWPDAKIVGLDSSAAMIARARTDFPEIEWIENDLSSWEIFVDRLRDHYELQANGCVLFLFRRLFFVARR